MTRNPLKLHFLAHNGRVEPISEPAIGSPEAEALPDRMQSHASRLVRFAWKKFGLRLDYSDASLTEVENVLDALQRDFVRKGPKSNATILGLSSYFGAYIGEVLRRKHGGAWTAEVPDLNPPSNGVEVAGLIFVPARSTYLRLTEGSAFSVRALCQKFEEAVSQRCSVRDEPATGVKRVREFAHNCAVQAVDDAKKKFDLKLDYTEASLEFLETILSRTADLVADRVPATQRLTDQGKMLLKAEGALNYGAYLGEILCKNLGGSWQDIVPGSEVERIVVVAGGAWFDPLECTRVSIVSPREDISAKKFYFHAKKIAQVDGVIICGKKEG